jgi:hypothetical protein
MSSRLSNLFAKAVDEADFRIILTRLTTLAWLAGSMPETEADRVTEVTSVKVVEIGVEFEVAIGQAATGGSLSSSASSSRGVSSAIPSICM